VKGVRLQIEGADEWAAGANDDERGEDEERQRGHDPAHDAERSPSRSKDEAGRKIGVKDRGREERRRRPERRLAEGALPLAVRPAHYHAAWG